MKRVGIVAPGHFKRLAAEVGFLHAYYEACQNGFPVPEYMTGVSAGGIAVACAAQWTEPDFKRTEEILLGLKRKDFYGINPKLEVLGGLAGVAALGSLLPTDKDTIKNPWIRYSAKAAVALSILGMDEKFVKGFLKSDSIFSNRNLYKLLERELRTSKIFKSPIKIEIPSVDVNDNVYSIVSNYRPEDQKPEILLKGIVDSTRLPVFFPFRKDKNGHYLADGAAKSNAPVNLARNFGCEVIIVLKFRCKGEGSLDCDYDHWIPGLQRFVDLLVDERTRVMIRDYEYVNHDLEQEDKVKCAIEILESGSNQTSLELEAANLLKRVKLSASGKRKIKIIVVDSEEIPEFHFSNFDKDAQRESINKGYDSFWAIEDELIEAIES